MKIRLFSLFLKPFIQPLFLNFQKRGSSNQNFTSKVSASFSNLCLVTEAFGRGPQSFERSTCVHKMTRHKKQQPRRHSARSSGLLLLDYCFLYEKNERNSKLCYIRLSTIMEWLSGQNFSCSGTSSQLVSQRRNGSFQKKLEVQVWESSIFHQTIALAEFQAAEES